MDRSARRDDALLIAALIAVALSMRAAMSCVGPLIGAMRGELQISSTVAGFLTTIPLVVFALTAPFAGRVAAAVNTRKLLLFCVLLGALGVLVRSYAGVAGLFAGTAMLGLATGTLNVAMPAWIRHQFSGKIGVMTGLYSTVMTASSALAAGVCQPLMGLLGGWKASLASPVALSALAAAVLALAWRSITTSLPGTRGAAGGVHFGAKQLAIAVFSGLQSFLVFSMLAWYPSMVGALCPQVSFTGVLMLLMQLTSLIPAFTVPIIAGRTKQKGRLACLMALLMLAGYAVVLAASGSVALVVIGTLLLGLGCGATLSLALMFIATQGRNASETAKISGLCQCIGYLIAALGPTGFGYVFDALGSWRPVLLMMVALSAAMAALGIVAGKAE